MATVFTLLVATLTQLFASFYNYQYFNALGIERNFYPLTLEDNIQTALTQLPTFCTSILFPFILGFAFNFHFPRQKKTLDETHKKTHLQLIKGYFFKLLIGITFSSIAYFYLPTRYNLYGFIYVTLIFLLVLSVNSIESFSLTNDIPSILSTSITILILLVVNLQIGEYKGTEHRLEKENKYLIKLKNEQEEFIACTAMRIFSNDVLLVQNGKVTFIKKDTVQEITVLK